MRAGWCAVGGGGGPVTGGRLSGGVLRLEKGSLRTWAWSVEGRVAVCMQVPVVAVCESRGRFGDGRPLHVRCRSPGVVGMAA